MNIFNSKFGALSSSAIVLGCLLSQPISANLNKSVGSPLVDYFGHYDKNGRPLPFAKLTPEEEKANDKLIQSMEDSQNSSQSSVDNTEGLSGEEVFASKQFGSGVQECSLAMLKRAHLSQIKDIHDDLKCKVSNGDYCQIKLILDEVAQENGLPTKLVYAVAYTENHWNHWAGDGYTCATNPGGDAGLMQVNYDSHAHSTNWTKIKNDPLYNARYATWGILRPAYDQVRTLKPSRTGETFYQSVYAVYNGWIGAINRPFRENDQRDTNFRKYFEDRPWASLIKQCP